jgi:23S rRNA pseudouridine1911/1915/1917 synthase
LRHAVTTDDAGARTDVLVARLTGASRALVAEAIARGDVRVNDAPVKPSRLLEAGDVLDYTVERRPALRARPEPIAIAIVYEDDDILVVDKPAGMVTHPARSATGGTLLNALLAHAGSRGLPGDELRAGLVHRLDRDTSGLLVVAKNAWALAKLGAAMKARRITREYLGLVHGVPQYARGTIEGPIGRDPHNRLKFAIVAHGKPAITHYEVREVFAKHAELVFRLETGRTHQIRVHLAALGHPILNDPVYGRLEAKYGLPGQALHAWRLSMHHPRTGLALAFEAEPPEQYARAKASLRR